MAHLDKVILEDLQDTPRALSAYDSENLMSIDPVGLMGMGFERFFAKPTGRKIARKAEMVRVTKVMAQACIRRVTVSTADALKKCYDLLV
jgi:hypothetical protein